MNGRPDYSMFPNRDKKMQFCQHYLRARNMSVELAPALVLEAETFVLVNHWWWGLWGLNRALEEGTLSFDYLTYFEKRIQEYYKVYPS